MDVQGGIPFLLAAMASLLGLCLYLLSFYDVADVEVCDVPGFNEFEYPSLYNTFGKKWKSMEI